VSNSKRNMASNEMFWPNNVITKAMPLSTTRRSIMAHTHSEAEWSRDNNEAIQC